MPRLVRADGVASTSHKPSCGLAPGCPAATDWLALLVHLWKTKIAAVSDQSEGRDYVDDLVAISSTTHEAPRSLEEVVKTFHSSGISQTSFGRLPPFP